VRVLLDACVPRKLKPHIAGHVVATARELSFDRAGPLGFRETYDEDCSLTCLRVRHGLTVLGVRHQGCQTPPAGTAHPMCYSLSFFTEAGYGSI
jgi:hypothetical protein